MYIWSRFCHQDPRFFYDQQFIFTTIHLMDMLTAQRGMYTKLRMVNLLKDLTIWRVWQLLNQKDLIAEWSLPSIFTNCRGSAQYCSRQMAHLMTMDANAGLTTFFVMLSCEKYQWDNMRKALMLLNNDLPNINQLN
uniref:Uncharacterized protein n=1 Tax=Plectus sambesii TaxID=2011161 RepID=A0A914XCB0_9BILA